MWQVDATYRSVIALMDHLPGLLSGFTRPVEVIAGEHSPLPRLAAEGTAAVFPDARLTIVPGVGQ